MGETALVIVTNKKKSATIFPDFESASTELKNWYRNELRSAEYVNHENTYIYEKEAVIDEIYNMAKAWIIDNVTISTKKVS